MTPSERLDEILKRVRDHEITCANAKNLIIDLDMECVPAVGTNSNFGYIWNQCREEMIKKLEEMRK